MKREVYQMRREEGGKVWEQANQKLLIRSSVWKYFPLFTSAAIAALPRRDEKGFKTLWRGKRRADWCCAAGVEHGVGAGACGGSGEGNGKNFTVRCATVSELHGGKVRARLNCCRVKRGRTKSYSQTG